MCEANVTKMELDLIINRLEDAINVCHTAPNNPKEQGYPYATGYSTAAMQRAIENLQMLMQVKSAYDMECG